MVHKFLLPLLLVLLLAPAKTPAQQVMNFTSLTTKDGLSANTVYAILKDRYGLLWFATEDGLNKFDGTNFTVYRYIPGNFKSLQSNEILSLHEDAGGNLWVGTSGGYLSMYDRSTDAFIFYGDPRMKNNVIRSICSDASGNIWAAHLNGVSIINPKTKSIKDFTFPATNAPFNKVCNFLYRDSYNNMWIGAEDGLYSFNPVRNTIKHYVHSEANPKTIAHNAIHTITEDKNRNMWIGTNEGLCMLQRGTADFITYTSADDAGTPLTHNAVNSLATHNNRLWAGTANGLNLVDINTGAVTQLKFDAHRESWLTAKNIISAYIDNEGICWLGTFRGGVNKYNSNQSLINLVKSNPFDVTGLPASLVTSFAASAGNKVFIGTDGGGLSEFDPATGTFRHIRLQTALSKTEKKLVILSLRRTSTGELLAGTFADGLFIVDPASGAYRQMTKNNTSTGLNANEIFCITEDHNGNRWLGTNGNGINVLDRQNNVMVRYTPNPLLPNDIKLNGNGFIRDITEDPNGNMWIATHGGGLQFFNSAKKTFTVYTPEQSNLPNGKVTSVLVDAKGNVWVGTNGGGLGLFDPATQKFITISELNGLQNNTVCKILPDDRGMLWLSTNKGISMYNPQLKKFSNYTYHNGVQRSNFITGAGFKSPDGAFYFGGQEGFNYFNPAQLKTSFTALHVILTDLKISNKSVMPSDEGPIKENISIAKRIDLNYKQNFAISFVGLNYTTPEQNVYAYKLVGFDKDWNYTGSSNTASYTNLDPGEYTFSVKSSNGGDLWNGPVSTVKIFVHPPFWRTFWAYLLYALIIIGSLLFIRHRSIKKIQLKYLQEQEKMQAVHQRKEAARQHELDQLKLKFLTNLSHEFRTPISLILGPVDALLAKQQTAPEATQLNMIKRNGRRLLNLVNQLLDFRKMEVQELKLQLKEGELVQFVKEVADSFIDLSERKKIQFRFSSNTETFYTAFDHDKIERIIFNILSNAFKFTPEGGTIAVEVEQVLPQPGNDDSNWFCLRFTDTGIGIPADKTESIFERFFQNPTGAAILNQGTGIGLSITKEFVKMHGGTIEVESELGKGSTFRILLPFRAVTKLEEEPAALPVAIAPEPVTESLPLANEPTPQGAGLPTVLLVEDNDDFRFYLKENLRHQYKIIEASNGMEGWQKALSAHPKLIVSDISMPHMTGIELCKKIKSDKRTSHIPVILLTAFTGEKEQIAGLQTGANDYITKPFNFEILNAKVNNLLVLNDSLKTAYSKQVEILAPEMEASFGADKLLQKVALYVEENLTDTQLSVEALSRHAGMSRSTLYSKLLELTGQTPVEFIRSVKLNKAAQLLEKTDLTIAEIAYTVGFSTPTYFAKSFKAKFNMQPSEYIAKMRKQPGKDNNAPAS